MMMTMIIIIIFLLSLNKKRVWKGDVDKLEMQPCLSERRMIDRAQMDRRD